VAAKAIASRAMCLRPRGFALSGFDETRQQGGASVTRGTEGVDSWPRRFTK
jgi:hypothetical protein